MDSKKDEDKIWLLEKSSKINVYDATECDFSKNSTWEKDQASSKTSERTKSGFIGLFRYASKTDILLMFIGMVFSILHGFGFPILAYVFGHMTNTFISGIKEGSHNDSAVTESDQFPDISKVSQNLSSSSHNIDPPLSPDEFVAYMTRFSVYYLCIGLGVLCSSFIQTLCWEISCERQVHRLKKVFISQILRQDISWYDLSEEGDLCTKLSDDVERIQEGIGIKFSIVTQYVSTFISGIVVGLLVNWKLTTFLLHLAPLLIGSCAYLAKVTASSASREQLKYSLAGGIANEVLSCIRTVAAFGGEKQEVIRYRDALDEGRKLAMKKYYVLAVGLAFVFFCMYSSYGLAFWYGAKLIGDGYCSPGSVFTVFFSVMSGAFSLGNALPFVNAVSTAMGAASSVFAIIDRVPSIDPYSHGGLQPRKIIGHINFKNVSFSYPARQLVQVLKGLDLDIDPGKKIALVGSSGAGKSTIVSLLVRFYDVYSGVITIDGTPISEFNLHWLRNHIGVVSQEPVMFGLSIAENICCGREHIMQDQIEKAAIIANAHRFIQRLPQGYNTLLGDRSAQLSGGQKQRIAIARAIVHNPKILLLDEATSALDAHSEAIVQEALEKAMFGRTTLIIAHRLSTVKNADVIHVMKDGVIVEKGTHSELLVKKQLYYSLVETQAIVLEDNQYPTSEDILVLLANKMYLLHPSHFNVLITKNPLTETNLQEINQFELFRLSINDENEVDMFQLIKLNAPEWIWLLIGFLGCAMVGSVMPIFAFFYGQVFATFTLMGEKLKEAALFWAVMFVLLGCLSAVSTILQWVGTTTACERLVMRVRLLAFTNIIRQPVGWFDLDRNSTGRLVTRLAHDAPVIKGAGGVRAGQLISSLVMLVSALAIAFIFGSRLAMVLLIAVPFIVGASYEQAMLLRRSQKRGAKFMDNAGRVASECIQNVRTVQSLGKEELFVQLYTNYLALPFKEAKNQAVVYAIVFAASQAIIYVMYAGAFRFGAYLIQIGDITPSQVYRVFFALALCAASVGQGAAYIQDYAKAKMATAVMFKLIKRKSEIDVTSPYGIKPLLKGKITFNGVYFHYPSRPEVEVLQGLDFTVYPGKTLAIVGASGCGKSTVIALLERFYDPSYGTVMVDNIDICIMNLQYLRKHIGLVSQEPALFNCSIRENIMYGFEKSDLMEQNALFEHIEEAAKTANIHNFIISLPEGYETLVGDRGMQLSGGQKQRIAIARALIRDPKILILDEATSALDTENEKIVQEALDRVRTGRTCIIIAHRLSTIQNADSIAVIHRGRIVEQGTHEYLMKNHGHYYHLVKKQ